jgi:hypothetical protein
MPHVDSCIAIAFASSDPILRIRTIKTLELPDDITTYADDPVSPSAVVVLNRISGRAIVDGEPETLAHLINEVLNDSNTIRFLATPKQSDAIRKCCRVLKENASEIWWAAERSWLNDEPEQSISVLGIDEAALLAESWEPGRGEPGAIDYIRSCIERFPGLCIRDESGEPRSWLVRHLLGSMGIMYTVPQHRRKGYARDLTLEMAGRIFDTSDVPFVMINDHNMPSKCLAASCGLRLKEGVNWMRVESGGVR